MYANIVSIHVSAASEQSSLDSLKLMQACILMGILTDSLLAETKRLHSPHEENERIHSFKNQTYGRGSYVSIFIFSSLPSP